MPPNIDADQGMSLKAIKLCAWCRLWLHLYSGAKGAILAQKKSLHPQAFKDACKAIT